MDTDYRRRIYGDYARDRPQQDLAYTDRLYAKQFGAMLPAAKNAAILELGCGWGAFVHALQQMGYVNASGVEQNERDVALAQKKGIRGISHGDAAAALKARPGGFDCLVVNDFLEHFRKDELLALLDLVHAALKPGGLLVGRVPNAEGLGWGRIRYGDLTHEQAFTRNSLGQALAAAGFAQVQTLAEEPVVTGARSLLRWMLWKKFQFLIKIYLFAESYANQGAILTPNLLFCARRA